MQIKLIEIIKFLDEQVLKVLGNPDDIHIKYLKSPENVDEFTLDWINPNKQNKQQIAESSKAKALLTDNSVIYSEKLAEQKKVIIVCDNPKLCLAKVGNAFFVQKPKPGIHPTANIHPEAILGNNIHIGPNAVIGNCKIGDDVIVHGNVSINDHVIIGHGVIIKSGAVLGFDGFGFEKLDNGEFIRFPQLGKLIVQDNVEIGSNTCIDRGSLSDTVIGQGTKINNLCHIAHNVITGRNVIITAQVNISGTTFIDDDVWIAPNASLRGHQKIGKGAFIGMGAVVTKDIPSGETWVGNPAKPLLR